MGEPRQNILEDMEAFRLTPIQYRFAYIRAHDPEKEYTDAWCVQKAGSQGAEPTRRAMGSKWKRLEAVRFSLTRNVDGYRPPERRLPGALEYPRRSSGGRQYARLRDSSLNPSPRAGNVCAGGGDLGRILAVGPSTALARSREGQRRSCGRRGDRWANRSDPPAVAPDRAAAGGFCAGVFGVEVGQNPHRSPRGLRCAIRNAPPQAQQVSMSMPKTRLTRCVQVVKCRCSTGVRFPPKQSSKSWIRDPSAARKGLVAEGGNQALEFALIAVTVTKISPMPRSCRPARP
jgi:hypothetical protein